MFPKGFVFLALVPVFLIVAGGLLWKSNTKGSPERIPVVLVEDTVPSFSLPPLKDSGLPGFSNADLREGGVVMVNVFASWCYPCRVEHPYLMELSRAHVVPIYGINYKDRSSDALKWLAEEGNPYVAMGADEDGKVSADWGISSVPETLVIDQGGAIRYRHSGPILPGALEEKLLPLIRSLRETRSYTKS